MSLPTGRFSISRCPRVSSNREVRCACRCTYARPRSAHTRSTSSSAISRCTRAPLSSGACARSRPSCASSRHSTSSMPSVRPYSEPRRPRPSGAGVPRPSTHSLSTCRTWRRMRGCACASCRSSRRSGMRCLSHWPSRSPPCSSRPRRTPSTCASLHVPPRSLRPPPWPPTRSRLPPPPRRPRRRRTIPLGSARPLRP